MFTFVFLIIAPFPKLNKLPDKERAQKVVVFLKHWTCVEGPLGDSALLRLGPKTQRNSSEIQKDASELGHLSSCTSIHHEEPPQLLLRRSFYSHE